MLCYINIKYKAAYRMSIKPKVSVCLAAYNGENYIEDQLKSILKQLHVSDELIVCDDSSQDETCNIVKKIGDHRIVLHSYDKNVGHVRNFERAIAIATGDLIFLADQDDIWSPEKYRLVVDCFVLNPDVLLVHHALSTIDAEGNLILDLWNPLRNGKQNRFKYLFQQLVKCQVFGCATAFRRDLVDVIMPFPATTYAHDHWIALTAGVNGSVFFLNKSLVFYRQHHSNITPREGLSFIYMIWVRLLLFVLFLSCIVRLLKKK
jgi:glycosyltransferase involved in cell wall biosynthesis